MKKIFMLVMMSALIFSLNAQRKVGFAGAKFLSIPITVRGAGLSDAYTALFGEPSCTFWNPAGLAEITSPRSLGFTYTHYIAENYLGGFSYVQDYMGYGKLGVFTGYLYSPGFQEAIVDENIGPYPTGDEVAYNALQAGITYAQKFTKKFSFGVNLKMIYEKYADVTSAYSFAIDAGTLFWTGWKSFRVAMSMQNLGPNLKPTGKYVKYTLKEDFDKEYIDYPLPIVFRVGAAMEMIETPVFKWTVSFDGAHPNDNEEYFSFGTEISYMNLLHLRGGYTLNLDEGGLAFGFGIYPAKKMGIDYAFSDFGALPDIHRVGLSFSF
jgi:hypothetical protein